MVLRDEIRPSEERNLCRIIFNAVAHKLLHCRSYHSRMPAYEAPYALLDSPLLSLLQHRIIHRVPTQPELNGEG